MRNLLAQQCDSVSDPTMITISNAEMVVTAVDVQSPSPNL